MREVKDTARFKRDYRREKSGRHGKSLMRFSWNADPAGD